MMALVLGYGCGGCVIHGRFVHEPPLARNVPKLERGKTTRAQVIEYFGAPDLEARGTVVTHRDDGPMAKYHEMMKRSYEVCNRNGLEGRGSETTGDQWLEDFLGLRAYSSIDDDHIALLYEELDGLAVMGVTFPVMVGGSAMRIQQNRLLILLNKNTGVVDEFGYRQEFTAR
jgi:hypothetical protein